MMSPLSSSSFDTSLVKQSSIAVSVSPSSSPTHTASASFDYNQSKINDNNLQQEFLENLTKFPSSNCLGTKRQFKLKVTAIGDSCVGKSCLIKRYCEKKFVPKYISTIGIDFGVRYVPLESVMHTNNAPLTSMQDYSFDTLHLHFFDVSGNSIFEPIRAPFYSTSQALICVFDVHRRDTFESIPKWIDESKKYGCEALTVCVCANMGNEQIYEKEKEKGKEKDFGERLEGLSSKRKRLVSREEGVALAKKQGYHYFETSAKTGENVPEMFHTIFLDAVSKFVKGPC